MSDLKECVATTLFGVPILSCSKKRCLELFRDALKQDAGKGLITIYTPNPEQLMLARRMPTFHRALVRADFNIPDGIGIVWASRFLGKQSIQERVSGREIVPELVKEAAGLKKGVFLLGGRRSSSQYAEQLKAVYPTLQVCSDGGAENIAHETKEELSRVMKAIEQCRPTLLCVAYGAPHQELWIEKYREELERVGVRIAIAVGGTLDVLSGKLSLPPRIIQTVGIEWLWRLIQEPWRWRRQLALASFMGWVFAEKIRLLFRHLLLGHTEHP